MSSEHTAEAAKDLQKRITMFGMVLVIGVAVVWYFGPQLSKLFEAERALKSIPDIEKRLDTIEAERRESTHDRKDIRRDVRDHEKRIDKLEANQERLMPRNVAPPPGWETVTVPSKKGI